jgi:ribosome assembly protein YihI (activator of Der GTPase)
VLENTKGVIKNWQSRETCNIGYTTARRRKTNQKHNTICVGHHYTQTNTNNVNKTNGGKDEPNIVNDISGRRVPLQQGDPR